MRVGPSRAGGACYRLHVQCEADPVGGCYVSGGLEEWASLADGTREARLVGRAELEQPRVQLRERLLLRAHVRRQRLEGLPKPVDSVRADLRAASHEKAEAAGRGRQLRRDGRVRREWELAVGSEQRRDCLRLPEQRLGPSRRLELLRAEKDGTERRPHRGGRRQRHLTQRKRDGRTRHIERAEHGRVQLRRCRVERLVQHAKLVGGDLWSRRVAGGTAKLQRAQKLKERLSALAIERERVLHERTLVIVRDAGDQLRILRGAVERPQLLEDFQDGSERKARLLGLVHVAAGAQHRRCAGGRGAASRGRARHVGRGGRGEDRAVAVLYTCGARLLDKWPPRGVLCSLGVRPGLLRACREKPRDALAVMIVSSSSGLRLHKNSVCHVLDRDEQPEQLCHVIGHDGGEWWRVRGWDPTTFASDGNERVVPESALQLCFSLLPYSVGKVKRYQKIAFESEQGACGRGLIATQDIKAKVPIFEEPPFLVTHESRASRFETLRARWLSYKALCARTAKETPEDGPFSLALKAFEDLDTSNPPDGVLEAAREIAAHEATHFAEVQSVLMRFATNQHGWHSGAEACPPAFAATALYPFSSRANHSCAPSMLLCLKEDLCKLYGRPFDVQQEGGTIVFTALRDIRAGERLTYTYSQEAAALVGVPGRSRPVRERRAILQRVSGFTCRCERCEAEAETADGSSLDAVACELAGLRVEETAPAGEPR